MGNMTFTAEQLTDQNTIDKLATVVGDVDIQLDDAVVTLPMQLALMNGMFWSIYVKFRKLHPELNIRITKDRVVWPDRSKDKETGIVTYAFTSDTVTRITNEIYNELVLGYRIADHMEAVAAVWDVINRFSNFADKHTREYQVSLDALSLSKLCVQKPMKSIIDRRLDGSHGTKYAEKQMEKLTSDLMNCLKQPGLLHDNCLLPFMQTKLLKRNQVPQMFGAYGPRSDITDEMMSHVISASAFSGLEDIYDFATESLSAKKAGFFNNSVISEAQYFARRCRLGATRIPILYPGWCGSQVTIPYVIPPKHKKNFIGKFVRVTEDTKDLLKHQKYRLYNDDAIELTSSNIDMFVGKEIQMWSPFGCRYQDGVCEHCAGYMHQHLKAYVPEDIHLGVFSTTRLVSSVTQKILSAKHLIKTSSKEFILTPHVSKYMVMSGDAILWRPELAKQLKTSKIRFEIDSFQGPLNDLTRKVLPFAASFTKVNRIGIVNKNGDMSDLLEVTDGTTVPYLSQYAIEFMAEHFKDLIVTSEYIDVPLANFKLDRSFLRYTAVNDDMVSYVHSVDAFLMDRVRTYTSIKTCLQDFSTLIYDKTDVSIFPIEIMLRCHLASDAEAKIPVITDASNPVAFSGLGQVISGAALSTKFAYEGVKAFLSDPAPTLYSIGSGTGFYDSLFKFAKTV